MTRLGYVKDFNLHALADFTALNCIYGAHAGFSLKVLGFA